MPSLRSRSRPVESVAYRSCCWSKSLLNRAHSRRSFFFSSCATKAIRLRGAGGVSLPVLHSSVRLFFMRLLLPENGEAPGRTVRPPKASWPAFLGSPHRGRLLSYLNTPGLQPQGGDVPHNSGYRKGPGCLINPVTNGGRRHVPTCGSRIPRRASSSLWAGQETQEDAPAR